MTHVKISGNISLNIIFSNLLLEQDLVVAEQNALSVRNFGSYYSRLQIRFPFVATRAGDIWDTSL